MLKKYNLFYKENIIKTPITCGDKLLEKKSIVDPHDEEDWDEIDSNVTIFKLWIGAVNKEINLIYFPAYQQKYGNDKVIIRDDKFRKIFIDRLDRFDNNAKMGIQATSNCYIIHNDSIESSVDLIINFIIFALEKRKKKCDSVIRKYQKILRGDYYDEDEDKEYDEDDIDHDELEKKIESEKLLKSNIQDYLKGDNIEKQVRKKIRELKR